MVAVTLVPGHPGALNSEAGLQAASLAALTPRHASRDALRSLLHGIVDALLVDRELLRDLLGRFELCLLECRLNGRLADDDERGLAGVDRLSELLDVRARHALPQVPAHAADGRADQRATDDRRWEQNPDERARRGPAPCTVPRRGLVFVDVDFALVVLRDDGRVVGPDRTEGVEVLDDVVVRAGVHLAGVGPDVNEDTIGFGHGVLLSATPVLRPAGRLPGEPRRRWSDA